jgi:hypothetical protein
MPQALQVDARPVLVTVGAVTQHHAVDALHLGRARDRDRAERLDLLHQRPAAHLRAGLEPGRDLRGIFRRLRLVLDAVEEGLSGRIEEARVERDLVVEAERYRERFAGGVPVVLAAALDHADVHPGLGEHLRLAVLAAHGNGLEQRTFGGVCVLALGVLIHGRADGTPGRWIIRTGPGRARPCSDPTRGGQAQSQTDMR